MNLTTTPATFSAWRRLPGCCCLPGGALELYSSKTKTGRGGSGDGLAEGEVNRGGCGGFVRIMTTVGFCAAAAAARTVDYINSLSHSANYYYNDQQQLQWQRQQQPDQSSPPPATDPPETKEWNLRDLPVITVKHRHPRRGVYLCR